MQLRKMELPLAILSNGSVTSIQNVYQILRCIHFSHLISRTTPESIRGTIVSMNWVSSSSGLSL